MTKTLTSIPVRPTTKDDLYDLKVHYRETYDDVISRLIETAKAGAEHGNKD